ncbi:MAG: hypothetical protein U1E05_24505 [Patescibacteria group bacterium]|nr:hypothetical protein [Patescibacteria group bacterium]
MSKSTITRTFQGSVLIAAALLLTSVHAASPDDHTHPLGDHAKLVLVENGASRVPIVVFEGAPPMTRRAAEELAEYIEKISGAKPEVIEGCPDPVPASAIWSGTSRF